MKNIFIEKAINKHGDKFDYSKVDYVDARTLVKIVCKKHNTIFTQTPSHHLTSMYCCPTCRSDISIVQKEVFKNKTIEKLSEEEVVTIIRDIYGEECFSFNKLVYKNNKTPFTLVCKKHGTEISKILREFKNKVPNNHCPDCKKEATAKIIKDRFIKKHGVIYDYSRCPSDMGHNSRIQIGCPKHGWIEQSVNSHLKSDYGCGICGAEVNFDFLKSQWIHIANQKNKKPILYCILCNNTDESFIKVGITVNNLHVRYSSKRTLPYTWSTLFIKESTAENVWDIEQKLKKQSYKKYNPKLSFEGKTECYETVEKDSIESFIDNLLL